MKNVVLLAPYFLPRRRVGAWRPFKFAIHLRQFGWQPHIITLQENQGELTAKEKDLLHGIPIHKITPPFDLTSSSDSQLTTSAAKENSGESFLQPVLSWIDKQFPVDTWLPLFLIRRRKIASIIKNIDPQVIWSTGDPWANHWLCKGLSHQFSWPWVADFRDPWTLSDMNIKKRSGFSSAIDKKVERSIIREADRIIFTSTSAEKLYKSHYREHAAKMSTIYNAFDEELYNSPKKKGYSFSEDKLNLLFFGQFRRLSPAKVFIDIISGLKRKKNEIARRIVMHSFGPLSDTDKKYAKENDVLENFNILQQIPAEDMLSILPNADILWLSTALDRRNIIPAKLWDYLAVRRPVLSTAPNPEIEDILTKTGSGVQFNGLKKDDIIWLLNDCVVAKLSGQRLPIPFDFNRKAVSRHEAKNTTRQLAHHFEELI